MANRRIWATSLILSTFIISGIVAGFCALSSGSAAGRPAYAAVRALAARAMRVPPEHSASAAGFASLDFPSSAESPEEVRWVVRTMGAAGPEATTELRRAALESTDPLIAGNAVRALGRVSTVAGDGEFLRLLDDSRPRVRQELILALGSSGNPRSIDELVPFLEDEDSTTRILAIRSIGRIGGPQARQALERAGLGAERAEAERAFLREALSYSR